jgi:transposase-like protein
MSDDVQRATCNACGAEATCTCGAPSTPPGQRLQGKLAANPAKSNRAIASEVGVSRMTVQRARSSGTSVPDERIIRGDGSAFGLRRPRRGGETGAGGG